MSNTKWSDPKVCFDGRRPAEIPKGAVVQYFSNLVWYPWVDDESWPAGLALTPITYRYELPPVETEPFAVVFYSNGDCYVDFQDHDYERLRNSISQRVENEECIVRFYDKRGNQVEPEALEEATT
mgnify:CR=1 FL=1